MNTGTILVIDDELESLQLLTNILRAEGYHVRPADNGELALRSLRDQAPDLMLLDIRMPGLNGFELCRQLKLCAETRDIPLIFISGSHNSDERIQGLKLGAVDFISKPFRKEELLARIHTHLELGRLRAHLEKRVAERTAELMVANQQLQQDLVERRLAEQTLRETEARFRNMADTAPVLIWVAGPDKLRTFFNKTWLNFTGRGTDQQLGDGWISDVHRDDQRHCYETYSSSFEARRPVQMEYRLRRADGEYRWLLETGVPRFEPAGTFVGYIGSCMDLTELKLSQERTLASQKLESLGMLAAGLAHDFNNLLGAIFAEADLAFTEIPSDSRPRKNLERICAVATRASEVLNLLMAYAGGKSDETTFEAVDLSLLFEEMLGLLKVSISNKATLETSFDRNCPFVRANPIQLQRVFMNVVTNASEALGESEGVIRISTKFFRKADGTHNTETAGFPEGDYVLLEVSDTGCGMSRQAFAKAFDPFYTTKSMGRGLGLSAVQGIVRSHRGAIHVTSAPGQGSTFRVFLPGACSVVDADLRRPLQEAAPQFHHTIAQTETVPSGQVILLVEDEETIRLVLSLSLQKNGFTVLEARDGWTALDLFRERAREITASVLDLNLPGISGVEVFQEFRRIRPDAKIVITSAYDGERVNSSFGVAGQASCTFIKKPYRVAEFLSALRALLQQEEARAKSAAIGA